MLLIEIFGTGVVSRALPPKDLTKKVQPVKRIAKTDGDVDVKKKPVPKGRIDTYV